MEEKTEVSKSQSFVERLSFKVVVGFTDEGTFVLEFLKPELSLYAEEETGRIIEHGGRLVSDVRIYLPPKTAKKMLSALEKSIKDYEKKFGEIEVEISGEEE
ncbi:DUF3467 domain-containing protein [Thermococcus sp. MV5]|uniref:DUF3467 domain-containing protein n=1 Tax=Thermococcus sp. MV5 TaxID=1638272 RepID=UPI00143BD5BA|nr:DUF3467 domain-containing protein [Thermococcus sp. MV5]NJE26439.1 DUF3467 domain-containing protein [Thermococcus sp. MV5]